MRTVFVLRNEELGYVDTCPVFTNEEEAREEAAFKCREHTVLEVPDTYPRCKPSYPSARCEYCAIRAHE